MIRTVRSLALVAMIVFATGASADMILQYTFDEASGDALDTGVAPAADATLVGDTIGRTSNTPSGTGNALDLGLGQSGGELNYTTTGGAVSKLNGLTAMTMTFWMNVQNAPTAGDRIFCNFNGADGIDLSMNLIDGATPITASDFRLDMKIWDGGSSSLKTTGATALGADDEWLFVAFVFDGTAQTLRAYFGDTATAIAEIGGAATTSITDLGTTTEETELGHYAPHGTTTNRTPPIFLDNMRIYDTTLNESEIEAIRVAEIPEPSTMGLLGVGAVMIGLGRRRKPRQSSCSTIC